MNDYQIPLGSDEYGSAIRRRLVAALTDVAEAQHLFDRQHGGLGRAHILERLATAAAGVAYPEFYRWKAAGADPSTAEPIADDLIRGARLSSLGVLLTRVVNGIALTEDEGRLLVRHFDEEVRESTTARELARGASIPAEQLHGEQQAATGPASPAVTMADAGAAVRPEIAAGVQRCEETSDMVRERVAAAIYERNNPGHDWKDAHPDDRICYGSDADAALTVFTPILTRSEETNSGLARAQLAPAAADAATTAHVFAGLHSSAEQSVDRVITAVEAGPPSGAAVTGEWESGWDCAMEAVRGALEPARAEADATASGDVRRSRDSGQPDMP
ncbi:hypothetical protein [Streptomyces sp. NPDC055109]